MTDQYRVDTRSDIPGWNDEVSMIFYNKEDFINAMFSSAEDAELVCQALNEKHRRDNQWAKIKI